MVVFVVFFMVVMVMVVVVMFVVMTVTCEALFEEESSVRHCLVGILLEGIDETLVSAVYVKVVGVGSGDD